MTNIQLIASLSIYILSIVVALVLTITSKKRLNPPVKLVLIFHFLLFLLFLIYYFSGANSKYIQFLFLFFFCSGIVLSGLMIRSKQPLFLRLYPTLFLASILFFIVSPSKTIQFITFSWNSNFQNRWKLSSNYFMEEERSMLSTPDFATTYKITRQFGVFHKTLARNISFGNRLDSIKMIDFDEEKAAVIRGYFIRKTNTFETCDSLDVSVPFVASKNTIIQKR